MGIKHIDGDFGPEHFSRSFGFSGSATSDNPKPDNPTMPPAAVEGVEAGWPSDAAEAHALSTGHDKGAEYAHGGHIHPHGHNVVRHEMRHDGAMVMHHAHGGFTVHHRDGKVTHHHADGHVIHHAMGGHHPGAAMHTHPDGHQVSHVESHHDREIHHHAHGGYTVHHDDGRITHHSHDGTPVGHAMGGTAHTYARGGDVAQDKALVVKGVHQHEDHEHHGEHTDLHLARGGMPMPGRRPRVHKPPMAKSPLTEDSALNRPPRRPEMSTTPRNEMSGGEMPYGVQPSSEPDLAGSEQGIPQLRHGGRMPKR